MYKDQDLDLISAFFTTT